MSQTEQPAKIPPIFLEGSIPRTTYCATCCMLYLGTLSADPLFTDGVKEAHQKAIESGQEFLMVTLPERDNLQLQLAITVAPSTYFPQTPMPVCWTHIGGFRPPTAEERAQQDRTGRPHHLIPGKAFGVEQYRGQ